MWGGVIIFFGAFTLYAYVRLRGFRGHPPSNRTDNPTKAEKLFNSKVYDAAFFDGASEDYTEAITRIRQYGGG